MEPLLSARDVNTLRSQARAERVNSEHSVSLRTIKADLWEELARRAEGTLSLLQPDWGKWEPIVAHLHALRYQLVGLPNADERIKSVEEAIREIERIHHPSSRRI